jgi:hypothetical protein
MARELSSFSCPVEGCPGTCRPYKGDGRFYVHREVHINIPTSFTIPKCDVCLQDAFPNEDLYTALVGVMEIEYQRHADMIRSIKEQAARVQ